MMRLRFLEMVLSAECGWVWLFAVFPAGWMRLLKPVPDYASCYLGSDILSYVAYAS